MVNTLKHTAAEWLALNPRLRVNEIGIERDTKKQKIGDGVTQWKELPYQFTKATADALYAPISAVGPALLEDPADLGTFIVVNHRLTEDPSDPGTYLIGV